MDYNLGTAGLATFTTFQSYIEKQDWNDAADDLYTTLWCSQVGTRCSRDAEQIRGCAYRSPAPTDEDEAEEPFLQA